MNHFLLKTLTEPAPVLPYKISNPAIPHIYHEAVRRGYISESKVLALEKFIDLQSTHLENTLQLFTILSLSFNQNTVSSIVDFVFSHRRDSPVQLVARKPDQIIPLVYNECECSPKNDLLLLLENIS